MPPIAECSSCGQFSPDIYDEDEMEKWLLDHAITHGSETSPFFIRHQGKLLAFQCVTPTEDQLSEHIGENE